MVCYVHVVVCCARLCYVSRAGTWYIYDVHGGGWLHIISYGALALSPHIYACVCLYIFPDMRVAHQDSLHAHVFFTLASNENTNIIMRMASYAHITML